MPAHQRSRPQRRRPPLRSPSSRRSRCRRAVAAGALRRCARRRPQCSRRRRAPTLVLEGNPDLPSPRDHSRRHPARRRARPDHGRRAEAPEVLADSDDPAIALANANERYTLTECALPISTTIRRDIDAAPALAACAIIASQAHRLGFAGGRRRVGMTLIAAPLVVIVAFALLAAWVVTSTGSSRSIRSSRKRHLDVFRRFCSSACTRPISGSAWGWPGSQPRCSPARLP